jgi:predicted membrane channel-forming protein YqfA (hemolysin III family)
VISEVLYRFWSEWLRIISGFVGFIVAGIFGITPSEMLSEPALYWWVILFWLPGLLATGPAQTRRTYLPWFALGIASYLSAFAIWQTGKIGHPLCDPDALIQAHAVWHLLSAVSTVCFFFFLRTERHAHITE